MTTAQKNLKGTKNTGRGGKVWGVVKACDGRNDAKYGAMVEITQNLGIMIGWQAAEAYRL